MKNIGLLALLPALTCAFFLPIPPLFDMDMDTEYTTDIDTDNHLLNSSNVSLVSLDSLVSHNSTTSNSSHDETRNITMNDTDFKEICTIVHFAESKFCGNTTSVSVAHHVPPQFCSLLSLMNQTFCQDETAEKGEKGEKHVNQNQNQILNPNISEKNENVYEKFYVNVYIEEIKNNNSNTNTKLTPKDLCPIFELVDKTFCTSHENENKLNPKELCPLLEFVEKEICV
jgi:hypothetical protein